MYALIGSGRLAHHFSYYFQALNLPLALWSRNGDPLFNSRNELDSEARLKRTLEPAGHILLAVSDSALPDLAARLKAQFPNKTLIHFSGALTLNAAASAHPLMTFGERLESPDWYRAIPFLIEEGQTFSNLLPGLPNPHFKIPVHAKGYYHALCSLAGNSSFLLLHKIGEQFEKELGLPRELLRPFLLQVVANSSLSGEKNFTGPVARGDWEVVRRHIAELADQKELLGAYRGYLQLAKSTGVNVPEDLL